MISKVGAVDPANRAGIGIGLLFRLLKATAEADVEKQFPSAAEQESASLAERDMEMAAQRRQLGRMRAQSDAKTRMVLGNQGVNPMYTMGGGMSGSIAPAHIMAASANQPPVGRIG